MRTKLILVIALAVVSAALVNADVPPRLSIQGILTDNAGTPLPDGLYTLTFRLYTLSAGGTPAWEETQQVPAFGGVFNATLGNTVSLDLSFNAPYWVGVSVNGAAELVPRTELTTSAYSFNIPDSTVTAGKVVNGTLVRSVNGLKDDVTLSTTGGASISQVGNTITIDAGSGGVSSQWQDAGSSIFFNTGNVGIGDATPTASLTVGNGDKLQVHGADGDIVFSDDQGTLRFANSTDGANAPMINLFTSGTYNSTRMIWTHSPGFPTWGLEYNDTSDAYTFIGDNVPVLQVQTAGQQRVGVGTRSPSAKFHVETNSSTGFGQIKLTETQFDYSRITMNNNIHPNFWDLAARTDTNLSNALLNIYHSNAGDILTVSARRRVGINDASPGFPLEVNGNGDYRTVNIYNTQATTATTTFNYGLICNLAQEPNTGFPRLFNIYGFSTDSNSYLSYGVYGFASNASQFNYGVYGVAGTTDGYAGYFSGNVYSSGIYVTSDGKFKKNIQTYNGAIDKLMQLRPVRSEYDTQQFASMNLSEGEQYGFIASELKLVFPTLVKRSFQPYDEPTSDTHAGQGVEFEAVNYDGLIPVLVSAVQEQQALIKELRAELDALKAERNR